MLAKSYSAQINGLSAEIIAIEADISKGSRPFEIIGLPDKTTSESISRLTMAFNNSNLPAINIAGRKMVLSLTPAGLPKGGAQFDLAIAIAILAAQKKLKTDLQNKLFLGEISLSGELKPIKGVLLFIQSAKERGFTEIYLPITNAEEASLVSDINIFGCKNLKEVVDHFSNPKKHKINTIKTESINEIQYKNSHKIDLQDIKGQHQAKRGLEIAAAGRHNLAMIGPPGVGKTILAKALIGILPPLTIEEALETTGIHSLKESLPPQKIITQPPFRAPHHTASYAAMVGGGEFPQPGEITLAHNGVLFLDEFAEFNIRSIEALRQPLENKSLLISRSMKNILFPANFMLIIAMNPCPCGYLGSNQKECLCSFSSIDRYQRKISGPIVDRIDLWVNLPNIPIKKLSAVDQSEDSQSVKKRIEKARKLQKDRYEKLKIKTNSELNFKNVLKYNPLNKQCQKLLDESATRLNLSARSYHKIIKLSRTIADLSESKEIEAEHLLEALRYRPQE